MGDIVILRYEKKLGPGDFRLGKVLEVYPDEDQMVRTVLLGLRKRRGAHREAANKCEQGLDEVVMAVQRLVVLQAVEDRWEGGFLKENM